MSDSTLAELDFDPEALRQRYAAERDVRLDANRPRYRELDDLDRDPFAESIPDRGPITRVTDVAVVGGGIGGLLAASRLKQEGVADVTVIDYAGDFGGTWYWNRYPGAQCDIESYIYLPMLEETGFIPTEKYAHAPEIFEHLCVVAEKFGLYEQALFYTGVTKIEWIDSEARWLIHTDRGDDIRARFVLTPSGLFSKPRVPDIPGIDSFTGRVFHTSRWDYDYTEGDATGGLWGLVGKRVAVIGTGATGVQCIPKVAEYADKLYVIQRSPTTVGPRNNRPTPRTWRGGQPGWQQDRMVNFDTIIGGGQVGVDLVDDAWTYLSKRLSGLVAKRTSAEVATNAQTQEMSDFLFMEEMRARIDEIVHNPETAESLKPYYPTFCKRPTFSDHYLPTFNRPNVTLVDTKGLGIDRIEGGTIYAAGAEFEVDCLIFATGFDVNAPVTTRSGIEIIGRDGVSLAEKFSGGGRTFLGLFTDGFPNLFMPGPFQTGLTTNVTHTLDEQARHIALLISELNVRCARTVETTPEAVDEWVAEIREGNTGRLKFLAGCIPGWGNNDGNPEAGDTIISNQYGRGAEAYFDLLREWRDEGSMRGLMVTVAENSAEQTVLAQ